MSIMPFIGESRSEAEDKRDLHDSLVDPLVGLSTLGAHANADFSNLALDDSVEAVTSSLTWSHVFTWGTLESYKPTDVMNQTDFVEATDGSAKLGQPYASVGWVGDSAALRLYYLPYFRDRTFQGLRGRPRFARVRAIRGHVHQQPRGGIHGIDGRAIHLGCSAPGFLDSRVA